MARRRSAQRPLAQRLSAQRLVARFPSARVLRLLGAGVFAMAWVLLPAAPAAADMVDPPGACVGQATWSTAGFTEVSTALFPDDVVEIPRADQVAWSGRVVGPAAGTSRETAGRIALSLPPPFGAIAIGTWGGEAVDVERSGTYGYDLPSFVPAGVELELRGSHDESGARHCAGVVGIMIEGGPFDSFLIWVALAGLLIFGALVVLLGREPAGGAGVGRVVAGMALGLPFGLFLALTLVLFGVVALASPLVTVIIGLGLVYGGLWTWWGPLGSKAAAASPPAIP